MSPLRIPSRISSSVSEPCSKNLSIKEDQEEIFNEELHEGDYVYVKPYEKYGTISSIKKDKYYVNLGQFAIEFKKNELSLAAKPEPKKKKEVRLSGYNPASHATLSLDLRGKRVEEVKELMDYLRYYIISFHLKILPVWFKT